MHLWGEKHTVLELSESIQCAADTGFQEMNIWFPVNEQLSSFQILGAVVADFW